MVQKRQARRSDQEWFALIQECRSSGMTDKDWCENHQIERSKFYYHIRRLRNKACMIPDSTDSAIHVKQEIVPVPLTPKTPFRHQPAVTAETWNAGEETAIRLSIHGFHLEITNAAAGGIIAQTIAALQTLS